MASWIDNFNDGSLDTTKFGTSVAGDGAVTEPAGETLNITMGANAANAALVYCKDIINTAGEFVYTVRHAVGGTVSGAAWLLSLYDGVPAVGSNTTINAATRVQVFYAPGTPDVLYAYYLNAAGTAYYWTGSAWSTTYSHVDNINEAGWIDVSLIVKDAKWRISVRCSDNAQSLIETSPIAFSAIKAYTNLYFFWGEPYNNYYYSTSMKADFFRYDDQTPIYAWYNGNTSAGNLYKIGRCISYDGGNKYLRHPGLPVIDILTGESQVWGPHVINVSGILYMFYVALRSSDPYNTKRRIRCAHSHDNGETWTDEGYMTTPGGAGTWDENGHAFPVVTYDSVTNNFKMYVSGINASNVYQIGLFTADTITGAWSPNGGNPVIAVGAGDSWNETIMIPFAIEGGATLTLWTSGADAASLYKVGKYTSSDWIVWTPDGSNPIIGRDSSKTTDASNVAQYATAVVVADSTPFSVNDPIMIRVVNGNQHLNRILSIPDSTHINLWYHSPHAYTSPKVIGLNHDDLGMGNLNGSLAFLTSWFGTTSPYSEKVTRWEYEGGSWVYIPAKSPPLSLGQVWDAVSSENLKWIQATVIIGIDVTVNTGLQSGIKSLFPVSENTDQVLDQGLIAKAGSLFSPSFILDHILTQNLQSGNKTIFSASSITDQILSQNLLASIASILSVLAAVDQDISLNLIPAIGSAYEVIVDVGGSVVINVGLLLAIGSALESSLQADQILEQGIIERLGSVLLSSQYTDQVLHQNLIAVQAQIATCSLNTDQNLHLNALTALAKIYMILVQIKIEEKFSYIRLNAERPSALPEGDLKYEHSSSKVPAMGQEGDLKYRKVN